MHVHLDDCAETLEVPLDLTQSQKEEDLGWFWHPLSNFQLPMLEEIVSSLAFSLFNILYWIPAPPLQYSKYNFTVLPCDFETFFKSIIPSLSVHFISFQIFFFFQLLVLYLGASYRDVRVKPSQKHGVAIEFT